MLAISTSWGFQHDTDPQEWFAQIKELGVNTIELGYTLAREQLTQIEKVIDEINIRVVSIHNFCPLPHDGPSQRHPSNYYRLSALNEQERQKAVEWTKNTIDTAERVHAQVVVIHAGTIELEQDLSPQLYGLYKSQEQNTNGFQKIRQRLLFMREEKKGPYLKVLERSLEDVLCYAQRKHIKIGLETRYYPLEIPNFEEIGYFLKFFRNSQLYYWHDVGHAEIHERLGIKNHLDFLKTYQDKLIGMHIHGMKVTRDHLAPFEGDFDLNKVLPFLSEDLIKVIEARFATTQQLKEAILRLSSRG